MSEEKSKKPRKKNWQDKWVTLICGLERGKSRIKACDVREFLARAVRVEASDIVARGEGQSGIFLAMSEEITREATKLARKNLK